MNSKDYITQAIKSEGADAIAKRARVSRATLFRASSGSNVGVDLLQKILTAIGCELIVSKMQNPLISQFQEEVPCQQKTEA